MNDFFPPRFAQTESGHQAAGLELLGVRDPAVQIVQVIGNQAGRQRLTTHQVRQIGGVRTRGRRPADAMTIDARFGQEGRFPRPRVRLVVGRRELLVSHRSNSSGVSTTTRNSMPACCVPQYSAHCP